MEESDGDEPMNKSMQGEKKEMMVTKEFVLQHTAFLNAV